MILRSLILGLVLSLLVMWFGILWYLGGEIFLEII